MGASLLSGWSSALILKKKKKKEGSKHLFTGAKAGGRGRVSM